MATDFQPRTLQEAILFFADPMNCHNAVVAIRWPDGVVRCPRCGSEQVKYLNAAQVWKCYGKHERAKFSLKVGNIFEDSPLPLQKWLPALWLLVNCKNGVSSYELGRALDVTQKTAWFMLSRLRLALQSEHGGKIGGEVEVDETYIGGKARNMHVETRKRHGISQGTSMAGKVAVMCLLERHGKKGHSTMRLEVLSGRKRTISARRLRGTSNAVPPSRPMRSAPTRDWTKSTPTTSSTTPKRTWTGTFTPTAARISGAC